MIYKKHLQKLVVAVLTFLGLLSNSYGACDSGYPNQSTSTFILPYAVGSAYVVGQGNCTDGSHEIGFDQAYAYDFDMPIGTQIIASKAGTVVELQEGFIDGNGTPGQENFIIIQHGNNTVSGYYHLTQNGVLPALGAKVSQGEMIAVSGNTGDSSEPHLHFEVLQCLDCDTVPTNFLNTRVHVNGLVEGQTYTAEPFRESNLRFVTAAIIPLLL